MPIIVAIDNNKGGVGKTVTSIELATFLAAERQKTQSPAFREMLGNKPDFKVLAIDADSNILLTAITIGLADAQYDAHQHGYRNLLDIFSEPSKGFHKAIVSWDFGGGVLDIVPGSRMMETAPSAFEKYLNHGGEAPTHNFPALLYKLIHTHLQAYDVVVIDVGPGQNDVMESAIIAANHVIIPMEPALASVRGLTNFAERVELANAIQQRLRDGVPPTQVAGVLISRMSSTSKSQAKYAKSIREAVPCFSQNILENDETKDLVAEAIEAGQPVWYHSPASDMAQRIAVFAKEASTKMKIYTA